MSKETLIWPVPMGTSVVRHQHLCRSEGIPVLRNLFQNSGFLVSTPHTSIGTFKIYHLIHHSLLAGGPGDGVQSWMVVVVESKQLKEARKEAQGMSLLGCAVRE